MALTVDYSTVAPWLITIPKSDLTLESGTKYKLTVDEFWILLRDFTDNEVNVPQPKLYSRVPATETTPSITEIDETYYTLEFEDGLYSVNIVDGNTNIRDVEVKNQVSVNTNNTAGFSTVAVGSGVTAQDKIDIITGNWAQVLEGTMSAEGMMRIMMSALSAASQNHELGLPEYMNMAGDKPRISAVTDEFGNRTSRVLDET